MLSIEAVNHVGIRIRDKDRSITFYTTLGFELINDAGFEQGHPVIMRHASGVTLNLLGPSNQKENVNILMDVDEKHAGITHFALTVSSLQATKDYVTDNDIEITGSFSFGNMSAIFIRDPDRNVIELDAYEENVDSDARGYSGHPS